MALSDFKFERLSPRFNLQGFNCGDSDLNDFLASDALSYQNELLAVTYLLIDNESKASAFFSLSNDALKDQDFEKWNSLSRKIPNRKRRKDYPAVKIVRIGVDVALSGQGIGSEIVFFIKNWFTTENKTGCRFLLVDAYNRPEVLSFYERNDFAYLTEKDLNKKTRLMYFDLSRMLTENLV
jgi:GNAT superfamily N-acetyltransferase